MKQTFEEFLQDMHYELHPTLLDDDLPDAFNDWISNLDSEAWIEMGNGYALSELIKQNK
jgi:hypothetical protein